MNSWDLLQTNDLLILYSMRLNNVLHRKIGCNKDLSEINFEIEGINKMGDYINNRCDKEIELSLVELKKYKPYSSVDWFLILSCFLFSTMVLSVIFMKIISG